MGNVNKAKNGVMSDDGDRRRLPLNSEFMGQCVAKLDLDPLHKVSRTLIMSLNEDQNVCRRPVHGTLTVRYEWTPSAEAKADSENVVRPNGSDASNGITPLVGTLKVT